jgi:hypothetical protein
MVYNTQDYWSFGRCLSSGILETRRHNVSETPSVSVLRRGEETPTLLGPLERANLNHWTTPVSGRQYMSSQILPFFLCIGAPAFGFVGEICSIKFYLPFCPSSTNVYALSQFLLHIFLLPPSELVWSHVALRVVGGDGKGTQYLGV